VQVLEGAGDIDRNGMDARCDERLGTLEHVQYRSAGRQLEYEVLGRAGGGIDRDAQEAYHVGVTQAQIDTTLGDERAELASHLGLDVDVGRCRGDRVIASLAYHDPLRGHDGRALPASGPKA